MSTGLMSCVRENSPPIEMAVSESGAFSLPNSTSEQQKRRRFHPLRNLRRIFRRRTLSGADTIGRPVVSTTSSPTSQASTYKATSPIVIASVPAHSALCSQGILPVDVTAMSSAAFPPHSISLAGNRDASSYGLTANSISPFKITTSASGGFYVKSLRSGVENTDINAFGRSEHEPKSHQDIGENRDMTEYQRSLSEGRLVDSDFNRETFSQSRDSVFSESATASSLSLGLKAELFDVLRKRRNRPDASEEDLGLPHSPTTPQWKEHVVNQSEVSSLSLLSMNSSELDDELMSNYGVGDKTISSFSSGKFSHESSKTSDEIDLDISAGSRLSHSAAHHKMAVRPKKKGPTRHRRSRETSILPSTPEVNEDTFKLSTPNIKDCLLENQKTKSHSLPPGVNAKILEHHSTSTTREIMTSMKRSKTESYSVSSSCLMERMQSEIEQIGVSGAASLERKDDEAGFFKRFLHRTSKKMKKSIDEGDGGYEILSPVSFEGHPDNEEIKINNEMKSTINITEIRREAGTDIKSGFNAFLNSVIAPSGHELPPQDVTFVSKSQKPKSGPAARQRIQPQDLTSTNPSSEIVSTDTSYTALFIENEKKIIISAEKAASFEKLPSISITYRPETEDIRIPIISKPKELINVPSAPTILPHDHFEKHDTKIQAKIVGLSPFQQKVSRVENSTLDFIKPIPKQRKSIEKSKSFRYYTEVENSLENNLKKRENMPSLPDLTTRIRAEQDELVAPSITHTESKSAPMCFEINDNNLVKFKKHDEPLLPHTSTNIYTKNIILSSGKPTSPTCNKNINEIEENIDKLVKSPFITVLKSEDLKEIHNVCNISTTIIRQSDTYDARNHPECMQTQVKVLDKLKSTSTELLNKLEEKTNELVKSDAIKQEVTLISSDTNALDARKSSIIDPSDTKTESRSKDNVATTPTKLRRSSAFFEKSTDDGNVPEFMKIQLNRVDSTRPKTNVVLSKNAKETEERDLIRRFSNESVEITDTKPPLPPEATTSAKRNSIANITKSQEDLTLKSPVKKTVEEIIPKLSSKKVEEENILRKSENLQPMLVEQAKELKPKYIKKVDDPKLEKRKSVIESHREAIERETGVVLRKKSFSASNQAKDDTPELMKVFARRSLKSKDIDDLPNLEDSNRNVTSLNKSGNLDSDKENQSSSEEKLDKLPKAEIIIQQPKTTQNSNQLLQKLDDKNQPTIGETFRKPNTAALINSTTPKPFVQPIRYNAMAAYRSMSTIFAESKKNINPLITSTLTSSASNSTESFTIDENERNNNVSNNANKIITTDTTATNSRHTISCTNQATSTKLSSNDAGEFKGILQRRAEWEKRAKEASK